jgi:hypothetical protein
MCIIAPVQFVTFLDPFRADDPGIEITLREAVPNRLCDPLTEGELRSRRNDLIPAFTARLEGAINAGEIPSDTDIEGVATFLRPGSGDYPFAPGMRVLRQLMSIGRMAMKAWPEFPQRRKKRSCASL